MQRSVHTGLVLDMEYVGIVHTLHSVRGEPAAVGEYTSAIIIRVLKPIYFLLLENI